MNTDTRASQSSGVGAGSAGAISVFPTIYSSGPGSTVIVANSLTIQVDAKEFGEFKTTIDTIVANGGELVQPIGADAPEITARFRDPAGNIFGLYQQPK